MSKISKIKRMLLILSMLKGVSSAILRKINGVLDFYLLSVGQLAAQMPELPRASRWPVGPGQAYAACVSSNHQEFLRRAGRFESVGDHSMVNLPELATVLKA